MNVELIYDSDCPNVAAAREQLLRAFAQSGIPAQWTEWERQAASSPNYVKGYGSPTILVHGVDLAGADSSGNPSCRLYANPEGGFSGAPSSQLIQTAFRKARERPDGEKRPKLVFGWLSSLGVLPGIGAALAPVLPVGACPACWPAYAGLLSSTSLGLLFQQKYLLPLTIVIFALALFSLAWGAGERRRYGPFILGLIATVVVLVGKFVLNLGPAVYGGIILLVLASIWNIWPGRCGKEVCPACASSNQTALSDETPEKRKDP